MAHPGRCRRFAAAARLEPPAAAVCFSGRAEKPWHAVVFSSAAAKFGLGAWRRLRHLQAGTGLAGGLLGGDQGGADLHRPNLAKQG